MARIAGLTPLQFRGATYIGPTLTYFVSSKISKVTKSGTSNAGFNYLTAGIGFLGTFDDWIVNESVATVLADSADGGTPLQYSFTVLSIDGVATDSNTQIQNLNIDNILYMSDNTDGNADIVYKDNSNVSPVVYHVSGSSASLAALINTADGSGSVQTVTSGTAVTIADGTLTLDMDLASLASTFAITLPAHPTNGKILTIVAGGTIGSGSNVVTTLTITPTTGYTIIGTLPTSLVSGDIITLVPITGTNKWYIKAPVLN
jgi:hypothetical protein